MTIKKSNTLSEGVENQNSETVRTYYENGKLKEEVERNSNQPQNGNKESIGDIYICSLNTTSIEMKERIRKSLIWTLDDEIQTKDWMEKELSDVEDEIDEYRELESDERDDLDLIDKLLQRKEELDYGIERCEFEIELNESLLKKLKVKKIDNYELERFCNDYGLTTEMIRG